MALRRLLKVSGWCTRTTTSCSNGRCRCTTPCTRTAGSEQSAVRESQQPNHSRGGIRAEVTWQPAPALYQYEFAEGARLEPQLRVFRGGWVAIGDGIVVAAPCGQEALLRFAIE